MKKGLSFVRRYMWVYVLAVLVFGSGAVLLSRSTDAVAAAQWERSATPIVVDPGHGGEDGGATSCTGALESGINLEISLRLKDMLELLGHRVIMTRSSHEDLSTTGSTIAQRKLSDLKNRVALVNATENALLLSIHQNKFPLEQYAGAQVFYAATPGSKELAHAMQEAFILAVNPGSKRTCKEAANVYLLDKINCTGILIECGFLSNRQEEARLRSEEYQKQLVCVIGAVISSHLSLEESA